MFIIKADGNGVTHVTRVLCETNAADLSVNRLHRLILSDGVWAVHLRFKKHILAAIGHEQNQLSTFFVITCESVMTRFLGNIDHIRTSSILDEEKVPGSDWGEDLEGHTWESIARSSNLNTTSSPLSAGLILYWSSLISRRHEVLCQGCG